MTLGTTSMQDHHRHLVEALTAIHGKNDVEAIRHLNLAAEQGSIMGRALLIAVDEGTARTAYDQPRAFEVFIRGGGNVALYESVSAELARLYDALHPASLLDIGAGDGMALVPAVSASAHPPEWIDVVEPSQGLLSALRVSLPSVHAHHQTLEQFVSGLGSDERWDLAQATFALQSIETGARRSALAVLADRVDQLAIIEFDVPRLVVGSWDYYDSLARRYELGASHYGAEAELVAGGFLAPMLLGQLRSIAWSNYEQPAEAWRAELEEAGYRVVSQSNVHDYSWSTAFCMKAVPRG